MKLQLVGKEQHIVIKASKIVAIYVVPDVTE
jgi:hypothetical protein